MAHNEPLLANSVPSNVVLGQVPQQTPAAIEAYIGVPIRDAGGRAIGSLCVYDHQPRTWDIKDVRLLTELAESSIAQIERGLAIQSREKAEGALRESEARLMAAANNIPGVIFERRKSGEADWTYRFFGAGRHGLPDGEQARNRSSVDFVHVEDRDRVRELLRQATIEEKNLDLTFRVLAADGGIRWLRSQSVVRRDRDGTAVWDGICFDISDLVVAREAAEAARIAKDTLLVDVNHELRAPLQAILGFAELLKTEARPEVVHGHASIIQTSAQSLLSIVNQLLDLASGKESALRPVDRQDTDVKALVETCHGMIAPLAQDKGIGSALLIDPDVPATVLADGPKIQQILVNLLNNAIKFTEAGSVTLRVSRVEGGLRFSVSDTGIGIADDKVALLFQRFFRLEPSQRSARGTGLGLAIAKQLVEAMDGSIGVTSAPSRGATFWFELGAETVKGPEAAPRAWGPDGDEPAAPTGARILLADDLDLNRKLIADMLSLEGHEVDCVCDGAAAVRAVGHQAYDLVLMDMIMPVMDGIAATRAIRTLPSPACDVPIIAMTAHSFKEQLDSCLAAGMDATLTKPMSLDTLTTAVRNWTHRRSQAA